MNTFTHFKMQLCCVIIFLCLNSSIVHAQCADDANNYSNDKCAFLSWDVAPPSIPNTILVGGVGFTLESSTATTGLYKKDTAPNTGGCNTGLQYSGDIIIGTTVCTYFNGELTASAPLPVSLKEFRATLNSTAISLNWSTESELNNDGFEIQKSADGRTWNKIGWANGNGTSSALNKYNFSDKDLFSGINYYRLKQVDFDGSFTYSNIQSVSVETSGADQFSIYPNPAHQTINLTNLNKEFVQEINIYNQLGKKVINIYDLDKPIDVSNLNKGVYYVVGIVNNQKITKKLMVH